MAQILIAGCGYVGTALGERLSREGNVVWGLRRDTSELSSLLRLFQADLTVPGMLRKLPRGLDYVVYLAGPDGADEAAYRRAYVEGPTTLLAALEKQGQRPVRVLFASSTSVYAQQNGEWVDEDSPAEPEHVQGRVLLEGERVVAACPWPSTVVRLGGLYGPGRTRLLDALRAGEARLPAEPRFVNRVHRDDAAGILRHVIHAARPRPLYLAVDDEPADRATVLRWLAERLGLPVPPVEETAPEGDDPAGRGNKRCRNDRVVQDGYAFRYPDFRAGYGELVAARALSA